MKAKHLALVGIVLGILINAAQAQVAAPTWQLTSAPNQTWGSIAASADGTKLVAISGSFSASPVYLSTNSGATWVPSTLSIATLPYANHAVASSADGTTLAAISETKIYISTDSGATWTPHATTSLYWMGVACSADGTRMAAVDQNLQSNGDIYVSSDSGTTWNVKTSDQAWNDIACSADGTKLVAAVGSAIDWTSGGISVSTNAGTNWTENTGDSEGYDYVWTSVACSADGTKLFATEQSSDGFGLGMGQIHVSVNSGASWDVFPNENLSPNASWASIACSTNGNLLVAVAGSRSSYNSGQPMPGVVYTSTNSGTSWQLSYAPDSNWRSVTCSADGTKLCAASTSVPGTAIPGAVYSYAAASSSAPGLDIASGGGNAFISWPWPASGFVLQENTNLASTNWVTVPNASSVVNQVILPQTNANEFFRLAQP